MSTQISTPDGKWQARVEMAEFVCAIGKTPVGTGIASSKTGALANRCILSSVYGPSIMCPLLHVDAAATGEQKRREERYREKERLGDRFDRSNWLLSNVTQWLTRPLLGDHCVTPMRHQWPVSSPLFSSALLWFGLVWLDGGVCHLGTTLLNTTTRLTLIRLMWP